MLPAWRWSSPGSAFLVRKHSTCWGIRGKAGPWERDANGDELEAALEQHFARFTNHALLERLIANDVACAPVQDYRALIDDEQAAANGYTTYVEHPTYGTLRVTGPALHFTGTELDPVRYAPELGQHTEEVLLDLGYTWDDIEQLKTKEVI